MTILIVEEGATTASALRRMLRHLGFSTVHDANSGTSAMRILREQAFDLIFMGTITGEYSSIGLLRWTRSRGHNMQTPVIMMTENDQPEDVLEAVEAGASDYMLKPFDRETVQRKIERVLMRS